MGPSEKRSHFPIKRLSTVFQGALESVSKTPENSNLLHRAIRNPLSSSNVCKSFPDEVQNEPLWNPLTRRFLHKSTP